MSDSVLHYWIVTAENVRLFFMFFVIYVLNLSRKWSVTLRLMLVHSWYFYRELFLFCFCFNGKHHYIKTSIPLAVLFFCNQLINSHFNYNILQN